LQLAAVRRPMGTQSSSWLGHMRAQTRGNSRSSAHRRGRVISALRSRGLRLAASRALSQTASARGINSRRSSRAMRSRPNSVNGGYARDQQLIGAKARRELDWVPTHLDPEHEIALLPCMATVNNARWRKTKSPPARRAFVKLCHFKKIWSGRRGSNPRPRPWQGRALPLSYTRIRLAAIARRQRQSYAKCGFRMQQPERGLEWAKRPDIAGYMPKSTQNGG
jgi:hypothetical protein